AAFRYRARGSVAAAAAAAATTAVTATTTAGAAAATTAVAAATAGAATAAAVAAATTAAGAATAATEAAGATATAATETTRALFTRTGFVDDERAAVEGLAVHAVDGRLGLGVRSHFHEAEALGTAGVTVHHHLGRGDGAELRKCLL